MNRGLPEAGEPETRKPMRPENGKVEERLQTMQRLYARMSRMVDNLPPTIPKKAKKIIKDSVLGDEDLKKLMVEIGSRRTPRILIFGRAGAGKSSVVNAMFGAPVLHPGSGRKEGDAVFTICGDSSGAPVEILETRGIYEDIEAPDRTAEDRVAADRWQDETLLRQIREFDPDAALWVLDGSKKEEIGSGAAFFRTVGRECETSGGRRFPILIVLNKRDRIVPEDQPSPSPVPVEKDSLVQALCQDVLRRAAAQGLEDCRIADTAARMTWKRTDGTPVDLRDPEAVLPGEWDTLGIDRDGREKIEDLITVLTQAVEDPDARTGLVMALRPGEIGKGMARRLNRLFSGISATVALTPIPIADMYVLVVIEGLLVCLIAALSGREISLGTGIEFIAGMGGVAGAGLAFRQAYRLLGTEASKLLNGVFPGVGSAVSSGIAYGGTYAIGEAAIAYFIENKNLKEVRHNFRAAQERRRSRPGHHIPARGKERKGNHENSRSQRKSASVRNDGDPAEIVCPRGRRSRS